MDGPTCERLLEQLAREAFLYKTDDGSYVALPCGCSGKGTTPRSRSTPSIYLTDLTGISESGWLYTRGSESVRLMREEHSEGCRLCVSGPGTEVATHAFPNVIECMKGQAEIEQNLLAEGYQFAQSSSDRRSEPRMERVHDHRRIAS
jgi:hypothetical protein